MGAKVKVTAVPKTYFSRQDGSEKTTINLKFEEV